MSNKNAQNKQTTTEAKYGTENKNPVTIEAEVNIIKPQVSEGTEQAQAQTKVETNEQQPKPEGNKMESLKEAVEKQKAKSQRGFNKQKVLAAGLIAGGSTVLSMGMIKAFGTEEESENIRYTTMAAAGLIAGTSAAAIQTGLQLATDVANEELESASVLVSGIGGVMITGFVLPSLVKTLDNYQIKGENHVQAIEVTSEEY